MMAKRTLWQWLFGLMAKPEQDHQPMATPNNPVRQKPMAGTVSLTEDEWNERCSGGAQVIINRTSQQQSDEYELRDLAKQQVIGIQGKSTSSRGEATYQWRPGIEHTQPHPVKENPDGTLYYKGKVYRMIGDHGRHNSKNKRRQG